MKNNLKINNELFGYICISMSSIITALIITGYFGFSYILIVAIYAAYKMYREGKSKLDKSISIKKFFECVYNDKIPEDYVPEEHMAQYLKYKEKKKKAILATR